MSRPPNPTPGHRRDRSPTSGRVGVARRVYRRFRVGRESRCVLYEITSSRRAVTQMIAAELYDQGTNAIRFPSRLDGNACIALFDGARRDQFGGGSQRARRPAAGPTHQRRYAVGPRAGAHHPQDRLRLLRRQPSDTRRIPRHRLAQRAARRAGNITFSTRTSQNEV
jgi:hypothetical protein